MSKTWGTQTLEKISYVYDPEEEDFITTSELLTKQGIRRKTERESSRHHIPDEDEQFTTMTISIDPAVVAKECPEYFEMFGKPNEPPK